MPDITPNIMLFFFATAAIGAAVSAVTIQSPKRAVVAFSIFCIALGGLFYSLSIVSLAIAQSIVGIVALVVYQKKFKGTGERKDDAVKMLESPNQIVAVFVLLCFILTVTPIWIYSVWSPQAGDAATSIDSALYEKLSGEYLPVMIGLLLALSAISLYAFQLRRSTPVGNSQRSASEKGVQE